jgi:hypothetical protein
MKGIKGSNERKQRNAKKESRRERERERERETERKLHRRKQIVKSSVWLEARNDG